MKKIKKYGASPQETSLLESAKCREIVNEILNFGVNQHQISMIVKLLALELEDRDLMCKIIDAVCPEEKEQKTNPTITV